MVEVRGEISYPHPAQGGETRNFLYRMIYEAETMHEI